MKNAFAAFKNIFFVADDEKGIDERDYTTASEKIVKLENYIEILWKNLVEKKRDVRFLQENIASLSRIRRKFAIFGSVILSVCPILSLLLYGNNLTTETIIGPTGLATTVTVGAYIFIVPTIAVFAVLISKMIRDNKKDIGGLEAEIEYIETKINECEMEMSEIKSEDVVEIYTEETIKENLTEYNRSLVNSLNARLVLMNYLGSLKAKLLEEYEKGTLEKFLETQGGFSLDEVEVGKKFVMDQKAKNHVA